MSIPSFFHKPYIQVFMLILIVFFVLAGLPKHQLFSLQSSVQSIFQIQSSIDLQRQREQQGLTTLVTGTLPSDTSCSGTQFYCSGQTSIYKGTTKLINGKCSTQTSFYKDCDSGKACNSKTVNNGGVCTDILPEIKEAIKSNQNEIKSSQPVITTSIEDLQKIGEVKLESGENLEIFEDPRLSEKLDPRFYVTKDGEVIVKTKDGSATIATATESDVKKRVGFFSRVQNKIKDFIGVLSPSSDDKSEELILFNLRPPLPENFRSNAEICNMVGLVYAPRHKWTSNSCESKEQCVSETFTDISQNGELLETTFSVVEGICLPISKYDLETTSSLKEATPQNFDYNAAVCQKKDLLYSVELGICTSLAEDSRVCKEVFRGACVGNSNSYFKGDNLISCEDPVLQQEFNLMPSVPSYPVYKSVKINPSLAASRGKARLDACGCTTKNNVTLSFKVLREPKCSDTQELTYLNINSVPEQFGKEVDESKCKPFIKNGDPKDKFDLVIVGAGYDSEQEFLTDFKQVLFGSDKSFFNLPPINNFNNKFNIWYSVNILKKQVSPDSLNKLTDIFKLGTVFSSCVYDAMFVLNKNNIGSLLDNNDGVFVEGTRVGSISGGIIGSKETTFSHEMGHAVGGFIDEYSVDSRNFDIEASINCDLDSSCSKFKSFTEKCSQGCSLPNAYRAAEESVMMADFNNNGLFNQWQRWVLIKRLENLWS